MTSTLRKVASRFIEKWDLYSLDLSPPAGPEKYPGFSFARIEPQVGPEEWRLIVKNRGERYLRVIADRLQREDEFTGFVAKKNASKEIIASAWMRYKPFYEDKIRLKIDLRPDETFFFDAYCLPDYRGHRFQYQLMLLRIDHACRLGLRKGYTVVSRANAASVKTIEKLGFIKIKSRFYLASGSLKNLIKRSHKRTCWVI